MKKLLSLLLAACLTSAVCAADTVPLFNATLTVGKDHRFVLLSPGGKASSFLRLGESFDGYALKAYDPKTGELTLERDGKPVKVTLMADASVANAPLGTPGTIADATAVLDAMRFGEMMDKTLAGMKKGQGKMIEGMMNQLVGSGGNKEAKDDMVAFQKKLLDEMMSGMVGDEMKADVAKAYSEVFTKEQLQALGNFYSSPVGQTFSDKQPELAEKMNAIMMPRMMAAMPKVQKMAMEFGQQQRAKREAAKAAAAAGETPNP